MDIRENENCIIACILMENECLEEVSMYIEPTDFTYVYNQMIYTKMLENQENNVANDYMTIKVNTEIDIVDYMIDLANMLPTTANIDSYIKIQKEYSNTAKLKETFNKITNLNMGIDEALHELETTINKLTHITNTDVIQIKDNIGRHIDMIADGKVDETVLKTKFKLLDERLKIKNSNLIVIGARPAIGKTAYAFNIARNFARQGLKPLFVSLEMNEEEMYNRLLSLETSISHGKIQDRILDTREKKMLYGAREKINKYNFMIHDKGITVENLINLSHRLKLANKLDVLIVDYIGLLDTTKKINSEHEKISYMSRKLKQLAMKIGIPIIVLTQLNRNMIDAHSGKMREPNLSDIRSSGALEQDANAVMFLHQESDTEYEEKFIDLIIAKNRSGKTGKIHMTFLSDVMRFVEKEFNKEKEQYETVFEE